MMQAKIKEREHILVRALLSVELSLLSTIFGWLITIIGITHQQDCSYYPLAKISITVLFGLVILAFGVITMLIHDWSWENT